MLNGTIFVIILRVGTLRYQVEIYIYIFALKQLILGSIAKKKEIFKYP